jgi:hypothetical protein
MKRLLKRGYRAKERPSGHKITHKFTEQGGAIPTNLLALGNNDANGIRTLAFRLWTLDFPRRPTQPASRFNSPISS